MAVALASHNGESAEDAVAALLRGASSCTGASIALPPLPGARAEVEEIAHAWDQAHPDARATLLVGAEGTERSFKRDAPGRSVVHLATHGVVLGEECSPVYEGLRGVGGVDPIDRRASRAATRSARAAAAAAASLSAPISARLPASPFVGRRVWLALAGANAARAGSGDENEGLLTAEEVVTLDLAGVDWVVLSACQSGIGQSWPLEGSIGIRRAFRLAGAHAVIASQWSIADEATREWMRALYGARAAGATSASAAIRAASRTVLAARRAGHRDTHPFYWAAFTATGR
jgi:CHAT domain-containing protein